MVTVWPPTEMVPVREDVVGLLLTEKFSVPLPNPLEGEPSVIQGVAVVAVQAQVDAAVMAVDAVCAKDVSEIVFGDIAAQAFA